MVSNIQQENHKAYSKATNSCLKRQSRLRSDSIIVWILELIDKEF